MPLLIDGHNLIGRLPDLHLDDPHDEAKLVLRLRAYAARTRKRITVVFDHGLPGGESLPLSSAGVKAIFASAGRSADRVLQERIKEDEARLADFEAAVRDMKIPEQLNFIAGIRP